MLFTHQVFVKSVRECVKSLAVSCPELVICSDLLIPSLLPVPFPGDMYLVSSGEGWRLHRQDWCFLLLCGPPRGCSFQRLLSVTLSIASPKANISAIVYCPFTMCHTPCKCFTHYFIKMFFSENSIKSVVLSPFYR